MVPAHLGSFPRRGLGPEGSPLLRRAPLPKHIKMTHETARLLSKLDTEATAKAACCADPLQPGEAEEERL